MEAKQGDLRRCLGISRDTLRLYEKRGIIAPRIDPENGYRSYDDWQVNLLWEAKMYQGLGFSLDDIVRITQKDSLDDLAEELSDRTDALERKLRLEALRLEMARSELEEMQALKAWRDGGRAARFCIEKLPEQIFIAERKNHEFLEGISPEALAYASYAKGCLAATFWFPDWQKSSYYWGFSQRRELVRELGGPEEGPYVFVLPAAEALSVYLDAGERGGFGHSLLEGLIGEAARLGRKPKGPVQGSLVCRTHEEDGYHRFLHASLPLEA